MVPAFAAALSVYEPMVGPWWVRDGPIVPPQGVRALLMHLSQTRASVSEIRVFCLGGVGFKTSSLFYLVWAAAQGTMPSQLKVQIGTPVSRPGIRRQVLDAWCPLSRPLYQFA